MNKFEYKRLHPLKWYVLQNFPFIEADFDAITNYQLYCKVVEYLNKTIDNVNVLGNLVEQFSNYFDNLDVQEEINNKLDEMVEAGTLQEIVADYLDTQAIFCYDTVNDMKQATNLRNGSYAKTLGYYSKNDGGMSTYKIRNITNEDVVNNMDIIPLSNQNLVAELIIQNDTVNVKQLGAVSNNNIGDIIEFALNIVTNIIISDNYTINDNWEIINKNNFKIISSQKYPLTGTGHIYIKNCNDFTIDSLYVYDNTEHTNDFTNYGIFFDTLCTLFTIKNCMFRGQTICCQLNDFAYANFVETSFIAKSGNTSSVFKTLNIFSEMLNCTKCQFEGNYDNPISTNLVELQACVWADFNNCDFTNANTLLYLNDQSGNLRNINFNTCNFNHYVKAIKFGDRGIDNSNFNSCNFTTGGNLTSEVLIDNYRGNINFSKCYHRSTYNYTLLKDAENLSVNTPCNLDFARFVGVAINTMEIIHNTKYLRPYITSDFEVSNYNGTTSRYLQINTSGKFIPELIYTNNPNYDYQYNVNWVNNTETTGRIFFAEQNTTDSYEYCFKMTRIY